MSQATDAYVQVAADGVGKKMRNALRYVQQSDGTVVPVYEELVQLVDPDGNPVSLGDSFNDLKDSIDRLSAIVAEAYDVIVPGDDILGGVSSVRANSGLPAKAAEYNPVRLLGDAFGRQVVIPITTRDLVTTQTTTISASTTETTVLTGVSGVFLDVVMFVVSNTSASTNTRIDVRDKTGGTILFSLQSIGGGTPVGFAVGVPVPQTAMGNNWTMQCATSTTDIRVYAVAVKNR